MVEQAFGGADSRIGAYAAVQQDTAIVEAKSPEFFKRSSLVAESFEQDQPSTVLFAPQEELKPNFCEDDALEDGIQAPETVYATALDGDESSETRDEIFPRSIACSEDHTIARDYAETHDSHFAPTPFQPEIGVALSDEGLLEEQKQEPAGTGDAASEAFESPLQGSEYSRDQWPVLTSPANRNSMGRLRTSMIALAVLACAAGSYFLIRAATNSAPMERSSAAGAPVDSSAKPTDIGAQNHSPSGPSLPNAESATQKLVSDERVSGNDSNAQGRFSLQAAAFPTETGAEEFAGKLRHARVPSYVVPADLARRGTWFRVRIGRFNSADDAQRFAREAQLRARTVGMSLQLIVCQYE